MSSWRYRVVDVFTRVPLEGNALAVFPNAGGMEDAVMQRIAREMNLSETVFVTQPTLAGCVANLRIFTPAREMIFAGHPTVGTGFVLLDEGLVPAGVERFSVQEKVGPVAIRVERSHTPMVWLETPPIAFETVFSRDLCASILRLEAADLLDVPPQLVSAGNPTVLIAVRDRETVDRVAIDAGLLGRIQIDPPRPFCVFVFAPTENGAYSRMFAPEYGIVEDPATGSSTGPLGAYMKVHGLLPPLASGRFVSEQGTRMGRRSLLHYEFTERDGAESVSVGGYVTPVAEGTLRI